ncbi:MAG: hypothetical protein Q8O00_08650 [Holophaga sp.]|nr:hypothetical protein [Holophaga sp.]
MAMNLERALRMVRDSERGELEHLTPEQRQTLSAASEAREELEQAQAAFEELAGTPSEDEAMARLAKAERMAPLRLKQAEPIRDLIAESRREAANVNRRLRTYRLTALRFLGYHLSQEAIAKLNREQLDSLHVAYAHRLMFSEGIGSWKDFLAEAFPAPAKDDWQPALEASEVQLGAFLESHDLYGPRSRKGVGR